MRVFEQVTRLISSNGQNGQVERAKHLSDLLEDLTVGCISRIEYLLSLRGFDDEASP